jgi:hypothetical protein
VEATDGRLLGTSVASGRLDVELDFLLVSTLDLAELELSPLFPLEEVLTGILDCAPAAA